MNTINQLVKRFDNDYSALVPTPKNFAGVSIIIPAFNSSNKLEKTLLAINNQDYSGGIQAVVIDDGSTDDTEKMIDEINVNFLIDYIKKSNENNRSKTRNLGLELSRYGIIFFFDGDVIPQYDYLRKHVEMHNKLDKIVIVGFKENIDFNDPKIDPGLFTSKTKFKKIHPDYKKDWRYKKEVKMTWQMQQYTLREPNDFICELYKKSKGFKEFGKGRVIGVWDLPCTVVTNNMSAKKSEIFDVGGFEERFNGWGLEDTFLGAKLIANGNYIVPLTSTSCYHIKHSTSNATKVEEWKKNRELYFKLINKEFGEIKKPLLNRELKLLRCESIGNCYKNFWEVC